MLLKKAGMIVLGTAAGVAALSGTAFAGESPNCDKDRGVESTNHGGHGHHGNDRDRDRDRGGRDNIRFGDDDNSVRFSDDDASPSARNGDQTNTGDQLIGVNNTNIQAPISALVGILGGQTF